MKKTDSSSPKPYVLDTPVLHDYSIGPCLGKGAFSTVFRAEKIKTKETFAIKVFPKENLRDSNDEVRFQREINAMAYLHFDNVVQLHNLLWDKDNFYLIMDYCGGGELFDYIIRHEKLNEPIAALLFKQIAGAVAYCHSHGVAHRDLKPENILLTDFPNIKVTDFGLCGYINQKKLMRSFCGSPCYCSPECLCRVQYDGRQADIWSLGVTLFAMVTGEHPWTVSNTSLMLRQILKANYNVPEYISPECRDLISGLLRVKPSDRISMNKILSHPWMKFSELALVPTPSKLDAALSQLRLDEPEKTVEQMSASSSSCSSHRSDHGIISPFTDDEDESSERILLGSMINKPNLQKLSSSLELIQTKNPLQKVYVPEQRTTSSQRARKKVPPRRLHSKEMMIIKEIE